jgi:hypothetical protein
MQVSLQTAPGGGFGANDARAGGDQFRSRMEQLILGMPTPGGVAANGVKQATIPRDAPFDTTPRSVAASDLILETHRFSIAGQLFKQYAGVISILGKD